MTLRKQLRVKALGRDEDIEAAVVLICDDELRWRARVTAEWHGQVLTYQTAWVDEERDALAAAATWMRSHFSARTTCLVAVSGPSGLS